MCESSRSLRSFTILLFLFFASPVKSETVQSKDLEIIFEGNWIFSSKQLVDETNICLVRDPKFKTEYNAETLDYCLRVVQTSLARRGYLRAKFGEPRKEESERGLKIRVPLQEGLLYRLEEIQINGAKVFSREQLMEMLPLKAGDIARGDTIGEWLFEHIKKLYLDQGYIEYTAEPEPRYRLISAGATEGIVDFQIDIEEGQRFSVRRILFEGHAHTRDEVIRNALVIREGDFFSQQSYDKSVHNLNQLGFFEEIDSVKDLEMKRAGVENALPQIDLIIHLKEKARH